MRLIALLFSSLIALSLNAQQKVTWQQPPAEVVKLIDAQRTPSARVSPNGQRLLLLEQPGQPPLGELAQEELRIAGLRLNPKTNGPSRNWFYNGIVVIDIASRMEMPVAGLPNGARISEVSWSPGGDLFAFLITRHNGIELWLGDARTKMVKRLCEPGLSDITGAALQWAPDSKSIIYKQIPASRGAKPKAPVVPAGPVVRENLGEKSAARTYQDLLENPHDEAQLKYYLTVQLMEIDLEGNKKTLGAPAMVRSFAVSPDNNYLRVSYLTEPFSYLVPYHRFPTSIEVWDRAGNKVHTVAKLPLAESVPIGYGSTRLGPRAVEWRSDKDATLYWVEAQDGGDIRKEAKVRDRLFSHAAPFKGSPAAVLDFELRYGGVYWYNDKIAIANEWEWSTRRNVTSSWSPKSPKGSKKVIWDRSWEDQYSAPGSFMKAGNESGYEILLSGDGGTTFYLKGDGASPEGKRPFVDSFQPGSGATERLWQSAAPYYERAVTFHNLSSKQLVTSRQSVTEPANFYLRTIGSDAQDQLTYFENPYTVISEFKKELVHYTREDGVELSGTLYLPFKDASKNKNLPVVMWAYPHEFKSKAHAGQVTDSPYQFDRVGWWSPLLWLTQGYAVLDDPKMPIVGEGETEPNDTFIEQLVMSAKAAKDYLVKEGVGHPDKMAIGGHSYGAFMTANLLAHSDLFAAGIARSGAYNRTLTPFGFQAEERTLWEAKDIYFGMSPFMYADKVNEPLLLIHGQADNNSGTYPMQSERYYNALKGHGATARLVMLPYESHGYRGRESIMHVLWETYEWLETYVKNAGE